MSITPLFIIVSHPIHTLLVAVLARHAIVAALETIRLRHREAPVSSISEDVTAAVATAI